jgi:hypothetical protein
VRVWQRSCEWSASDVVFYSDRLLYIPTGPL